MSIEYMGVIRVCWYGQNVMVSRFASMRGCVTMSGV